ncbi:MAG TPA: glycosyltransferase family 4 protein [Solirubrobacterales bacterium]|nr:glycosyltransferase family 4 protein [Solirubrobacterales bacterium]
MKVLQVTSLLSGGPLEHSLVLSRALTQAGVEVEAVCADEETGERFAAAGVEPHVLALESPADLAAGRRLRALATGFDVVHGQDRRSGLWTRLWPRQRGQVRVYTVHGLPDPYLPPPVGTEQPSLRDRLAYRGLDAFLARRCDAVISPSRFLADQLVGRLGYPAERIEVIANGVEPPAPLPQGELVGTISLLEPVKGLDSFLRAAAVVRERRPQTRFAVYGSGTVQAELEELAERLGLGDALTFPGHVPVDEALATLRLYVLCSLLENCPMSLLEAMAAGRPALATAVGGVPEIAGEAVPLVPPSDPEALAAEILRLLEDPKLADEVGRRGQERVNGSFTAAINAKRTLALYERLRGR